MPWSVTTTDPGKSGPRMVFGNASPDACTRMASSTLPRVVEDPGKDEGPGDDEEREQHDVVNVLHPGQTPRGQPYGQVEGGPEESEDDRSDQRTMASLQAGQRETAPAGLFTQWSSNEQRG